MSTVIMTVLEAAGLTVSEKKTETVLLRTPLQAPQHESLIIEAAGQRYTQTNDECISLGGVVNEDTNISPEIERRVRFASAFLKKIWTAAL